jgi:hypothetical protein
MLGAYATPANIAAHPAAVAIAIDRRVMFASKEVVPQ